MSLALEETRTGRKAVQQWPGTPSTACPVLVGDPHAHFISGKTWLHWEAGEAINTYTHTHTYARLQLLPWHRSTPLCADLQTHSAGAAPVFIPMICWLLRILQIKKPMLILPVLCLGSYQDLRDLDPNRQAPPFRWDWVSLLNSREAEKSTRQKNLFLVKKCIMTFFWISDRRQPGLSDTVEAC